MAQFPQAEATCRKPASAFVARAPTATALLLAAVLWGGADRAGAQPEPSLAEIGPDVPVGEGAAPSGAAPAAFLPGEAAPMAGPPGRTAAGAGEPPAGPEAGNPAGPETAAPDAPTETATETVPARLVVHCAVEGMSAAALAENLASRVGDFEVSAAAEATEGTYLLEVEPGPGPARLRLLLRNPAGVAIVRDLEVGSGTEAEDPSRFAAVVASHMVEELMVVERPPQPMPVPAGALGAPSSGPGPGGPAVEPYPFEPEPAPPPEPPPFELALFGGIQGNDLGGSPLGAGTGGTAFLRTTYAFLSWLGVALEAGWMGVTSNRVDVLLHVAPLRLGIDFGVNIPFLHASIGPRFAVDVWTAELSQRQTGSRYGGGLFGSVSLFPWERFGFAIGAAVDFFPVAVQLDAGAEPAFALGWVRFLFSGGIVGRI